MLREAWTLAIETLSWMDMRRLSEQLAFAKTIKQLRIEDGNAVRLARVLVNETVRRKNFIDKFINNAITPASIDDFILGVQAFLRLYVYQTRVAKKWSTPNVLEARNIAHLVRSILGWNTLREAEPYLGLLLTQEPDTVFSSTSDEERVALRTFHPTWYVDYCFRLFGRTHALRILEADIQQPPTYIRINTLKESPEKILNRLSEEGVEASKVEQSKFAYRVTSTRQPLTKTMSFQEGLFYIQDKASCFAAEATEPAPDSTVLDVCAAPGAKTTYLAQLMQNRGHIYSIDYSTRRMNIWRKETARMGVEIAEPVLADACSTLPINVKADVVALDPPCTSTGTFGRQPSAKWRLTPLSIARMARIQWHMLDSVAELVKAGGTLVYSTCSMAVEENEMVIERFLKWHLDFSLMEIVPRMGVPGLRGLSECQRLFPHLHECNGFFIAKMRRSTD